METTSFPQLSLLVIASMVAVMLCKRLRSWSMTMLLSKFPLSIDTIRPSQTLSAGRGLKDIYIFNDRRQGHYH
jgi:hypothetical protein